VESFDGQNKEALVKALPQGQSTRHFQHGRGIMRESNREGTAIDLDIHRMQEFVTSLLVTDPAEGTPPRRPGRKRSKRAVATHLPLATAGVK
jgi:hypothetical protein